MLLGHTAVHSPIWVQPPKPSASCCAIMASARAYRYGNIARWVIFAPANNVADPFGHAATQAPPPMQTGRVERTFLAPLT